jgi:TonB family protein
VKAAAVLAVVAIAAVTTGCLDRMSARSALERIGGRAPTPEILPVVLNAEPPFRYPPGLWAQRVQGNVTLRVFVDSTGVPDPDSTQISESSGIPALDSAALLGAPSLRFRPARYRGVPVGTPLLVPVFFRHPDAPPLPGDTLIRRDRDAPFLATTL